MFHQALLFSSVVMLVLSVNLQNAEGNVNSNPGYEMTLSKVESRLNLASKMLETAKRELRNDLKQLCQNGSCHVVPSGCSLWRRSYVDAKPRDCSDIYNDGNRRSGIYQIWPQSKIANGSLHVYCDMEDGGGWTVIQRRGDFGNSIIYFYLGWDAYKTGFGHLLREFWIGNDNLFSLTNQRSYQLKVDLTDWDQNSKYATYQEFWVDDEVHNYTLHIKGYNGTAGDSLKRQNGSDFSAKDKDNDNNPDANCAETFVGAWWYNGCMDSNLNGMYLGTVITAYGKGVVWQTFNGFSYSHKDSVMKIRPADFVTNNIIT